MEDLAAIIRPAFDQAIFADNVVSGAGRDSGAAAAAPDGSPSQNSVSFGSGKNEIGRSGTRYQLAFGLADPGLHSLFAVIK